MKLCQTGCVLSQACGSASIGKLEAFVANNPDLKEELKLVTSYSPEMMDEEKFPRKEKLRIPEINIDKPIDNINCISYFIAYHENDLNEQQRKMTEQYVLENPHLNKDFNTFNKLKLKSEASIKYFNKEILYINNYKKLNSRKIIYFISSVAAIFLGFFLVKSLFIDGPKVNNISEVINNDQNSEVVIVVEEKEEILAKAQNTPQINIEKERQDYVLHVDQDSKIEINQSAETNLPKRKSEKIEKIALFSSAKIEGCPLDYGLKLENHETKSLATNDTQIMEKERNDFISREKSNIRAFLDENNDKKLNHWDLLTLATKTINTVTRDSLFTLDFTDDGRFSKFALGNDLIKISKYEKN